MAIPSPLSMLDPVRDNLARMILSKVAGPDPLAERDRVHAGERSSQHGAHGHLHASLVSPAGRVLPASGGPAT